MIVFTSDNGSRCDHGPSNGKLRGTKGTTWEGGQRVPCLLYWPGHILPGRYNGIFSNLDFYSSFAHLAGIPLPTDRRIDSLDLSGLLNGDASVPGRDTFFYYWQNGLEAVRQKEWKLHCAKMVFLSMPFTIWYRILQKPPIFSLSILILSLTFPPFWKSVALIWGILLQVQLAAVPGQLAAYPPHSPWLVMTLLILM